MIAQTREFHTSCTGDVACLQPHLPVLSESCDMSSRLTFASTPTRADSLPLAPRTREGTWRNNEQSGRTAYNTQQSTTTWYMRTHAPQVST